MSGWSFKNLFRCASAMIAIAGVGFVNSSQASEIFVTEFEYGHNVAGSLQINDGYFAGNFNKSIDSPGGEARNFAFFDIPKLSNEKITGATIVVTGGLVLTQQSSFVDYQLTSQSSNLNFNNIGTGTLYGGVTVGGSDSGKTLSLSLDAAAIADLNSDKGSVFGIGGRVISPTVFSSSAPSQGVYRLDSGLPELELEVTPVTSVSPVPVPGTLILFGSCLIGIAGYESARQRIRGARPSA